MKPWTMLVLAALAAPLAMAQPALQAVGVISLLGDSLQVNAATDAPSDTRIERKSNQSLETRDIGFDTIALRVAREVILGVRPAASVRMFRAPVPLTVDEQRAIAQGAAKAELPSWMVDAFVKHQLAHLLLISRSRGPINARVLEGHTLGRTAADGIGFYMDPLYQMKNVDTGALSNGLLAPYAQIKLTLLDTRSGDIVASYDISEAIAYASEASQAGFQPWDFMSDADKVRTLRKLVEESTRRGMQALLAKR